MLELVAYVSTFGILGLYAVSRAQQEPRIFDWANAVFFGPLTVCNLIAGATWAAVISFTFGIIGIASLITVSDG